MLHEKLCLVDASVMCLLYKTSTCTHENEDWPDTTEMFQDMGNEYNPLKTQSTSYCTVHVYVCCCNNNVVI